MVAYLLPSISGCSKEELLGLLRYRYRNPRGFDPRAVADRCLVYEMKKREKMKIMIRTWKRALREEDRVEVEPKTLGPLA
jgi:hypothetical protein